MNTITGTIEILYDADIKTDTFLTRKLVLRIETPHSTEYGVFQALNSRCHTLDMFNAGDSVEITFKVQGSLFINNHSRRDVWTNLTLVSIKKTEVAPPLPPAPPTPQASATSYNNRVPENWDAFPW